MKVKQNETKKIRNLDAATKQMFIIPKLKNKK